MMSWKCEEKKKHPTDLGWKGKHFAAGFELKYECAHLSPSIL